MNCLKISFNLLFSSLFLLSISAAHSTKTSHFIKSLKQLEQKFDTTIGLSAIDNGSQTSLEYRPQQRFPIQSTFKTFVVAAVLKQSETRPKRLHQRIYYYSHDLVPWSPITKKYINEGMTIKELCEATMVYSDNTAANILMKQLGGPKAVTQFAASIGNIDFQINHWETNLNSNPKDIDDSSTPRAMRDALSKIILGNVLTPANRQLMTQWMKQNTTGNNAIRAAAPKQWQVADKTGAGAYGIRNDIAIIWPKQCAPIVMSVYTHRKDKQDRASKGLIRELALQVLAQFSNRNPCLSQSGL